jgi:hypothetical protein
MDVLVLEVVHHVLGSALTTAKITGDVFSHRYEIGRAAASHRPV